jgi:sRNA-binding carbon storage regulator CsrA
MPLTLTRKPTQTIELSNGVIIEVYKVCGRSVSLRITAPPDVRIVRGELAEEWRAKWAAEDAANSLDRSAKPTIQSG